VALVLMGAMAAGLASDARNGAGLGSAAAQCNIGRTLALLGPDADTVASASGCIAPLQLAAAEGTPQGALLAAKSSKNSRRHEELRCAGVPPCMFSALRAPAPCMPGQGSTGQCTAARNALQASVQF
jgi:hypothetical protein